MGSGATAVSVSFKRLAGFIQHCTVFNQNEQLQSMAVFGDRSGIFINFIPSVEIFQAKF